MNNQLRDGFIIVVCVVIYAVAVSIVLAYSYPVHVKWFK